jgi:hypothetical protein
MECHEENIQCRPTTVCTFNSEINLVLTGVVRFIAPETRNQVEIGLGEMTEIVTSEIVTSEIHSFNWLIRFKVPLRLMDLQSVNNIIYLSDSFPPIGLNRTKGNLN